MARILRLGPQIYGPTGKIPLGRTAFWERFIYTGRLRLVKLSERARGLVEEEIDQVIEELMAERDVSPHKLVPPRKRSRARKVSRRVKASSNNQIEEVQIGE
jgi:hypothetical protein